MEVLIEKPNIQPGDKIALIDYLRSLTNNVSLDIKKRHIYADIALIQYIGDKEIAKVHNWFIVSTDHEGATISYHQ